MYDEFRIPGPLAIRAGGIQEDGASCCLRLGHNGSQLLKAVGEDHWCMPAVAARVGILVIGCVKCALDALEQQQEEPAHHRQGAAVPLPHRQHRTSTAPAPLAGASVTRLVRFAE
jgi:hypothetical protein